MAQERRVPMKLPAIFLATMSATAALAQANPIIHCSLAPGFSVESNVKLYKNPKAVTPMQRLEDLSGTTISSLIVSREDFTFVLNERDNRIEETDRSTLFGGAKITYGDTEITAVGERWTVTIDRVSGHMLSMKYATDEDIAAWQKKHGVKPPRYAHWEYKCKKTARAF